MDTSCSLYYPIHINGFTSQFLVRVVERQKLSTISVEKASMWSSYYDPVFLANYNRKGHSTVYASLQVAKHAARCAIDVFGNRFDRGDWVIGHFRAVASGSATN